MRKRPDTTSDYVLTVVYRGKPTQHLITPNDVGIFTVNKKDYGLNAQTVEELIIPLQKKMVRRGNLMVVCLHRESEKIRCPLLLSTRPAGTWEVAASLLLAGGDGGGAVAYAVFLCGTFVVHLLERASCLCKCTSQCHSC